MHSQEIIILASLVLYALGYIPYFRDIFAGKTKPHMISWGIWALLSGSIFVIQLQSHAGLGALLSGLIATGCFSVFVSSFWYGYSDIRKIDIICGVVGLIAYPVWLTLGYPLIAMILFVGIDLVAGVPSIRKTYIDPHTETLSMYLMSTIATALSLFTYTDYTFINLLYPVWNLFFNGSITFLILFPHGHKK